MEITRCRSGPSPSLPVRPDWQFYGAADSTAAQRQARLLTTWPTSSRASQRVQSTRAKRLLPWSSFAIHAVHPRNPEHSRLDRHFHPVTDFEAIEIIRIDRQAFEFLVRPPRTHDEPPAAPYQSLHQKFSLHLRRHVSDFHRRIQLPIE